MNANRLTADALQSLMRHKSYQTTHRYINMARQMDEAVAAPSQRRTCHRCHLGRPADRDLTLRQTLQADLPVMPN